MKRILIPTDFSDVAENAALYGAKLAKALDAEVLLLHVYHIPVPAVHEFPIIVKTAEELQIENESQLRTSAAHLEVKTGIIINYKAVMGLAVDVILEEQSKADIIIMGMRGNNNFAETLFGSITTTILRRANIPVLVIPEHAIFKKPEQIVFACDYNPETDMHTLDMLKSLMSFFDAKIYILNVKENKENISPEESIAGLRLEGKLGNLEHIYYFSENEDPVEGINDFVEKKQADMVAIIPHHHNLLERLFHKSVSKMIAFHTHIPMLSLPEGEKKEANYVA